MGARRTSDRKYTHVIVTYATESEFEPLLEACKHYAYVYHDKDETDAHYHIIAIFDKWKSFNTVKGYIQSEQNTFDKEFNGNVGEMLDYFTHNGIPDKAQYDKSSIVYDDKSYWSKKLDSQINQDTEQFLDDLLQGNLSELEMARKYGKDYIRNHQRYRDFSSLVRDQYIEELTQSLNSNHDYKVHGHKWYEGYITVDITYEEWDMIQNFRIQKEKKQ